MSGVVLSMNITLQDFPNGDDKISGHNLQQEGLCTKSPRTKREPNMPSKETILVVDDEFGPRESLRVILSPLYEVHTAGAGEEALRFIHDNDVDLVTLDLNMPGCSGFGVLQEIKNFRPDTEVIIVTAYGSLENAKEAIRLGAEDFIPKPFSVAEIMTIVGKSFERRRNNLKIKHLTDRIKSIRSLAHKNEEICGRGWEEDTDPQGPE